MVQPLVVSPEYADPIDSSRVIRGYKIVLYLAILLQSTTECKNETNSWPPRSLSQWPGCVAEKAGLWFDGSAKKNIGSRVRERERVAEVPPKCIQDGKTVYSSATSSDASFLLHLSPAPEPSANGASARRGQPERRREPSIDFTAVA